MRNEMGMFLGRVDICFIYLQPWVQTETIFFSSVHRGRFLIFPLRSILITPFVNEKRSAYKCMYSRYGGIKICL